MRSRAAAAPSITWVFLLRMPMRRRRNSRRLGLRLSDPRRQRLGSSRQHFWKTPGAHALRSCRIPNCSDCTIFRCAGRDPDEVFAWLLGKFGGERRKLKGGVDAVRYSAPGFSDVWILVEKGDAEPSEGHAIDHIGWRSTSPLGKTIDALRAKGVTVTSEPAPAATAERPDNQLFLYSRTCRREDRDCGTSRTTAGAITFGGAHAAFRKFNMAQ